MSRLNTNLNTFTTSFNTNTRTNTSPSAITIHSCDWWGSTYKGGGKGK